MRKQTIGKGLLLFSILTTVFIVAVADVFNPHHAFNPEWPPHARFHAVMQFTTLVLVSLFSLYHWRKNNPSEAALAPIVFWPGLFVANFVPGTSPYASPELMALGFPINLWLAGIWILITIIGWKLAISKPISD